MEGTCRTHGAGVTDCRGYGTVAYAMSDLMFGHGRGGMVVLVFGRWEEGFGDVLGSCVSPSSAILVLVVRRKVETDLCFIVCEWGPIVE